MEYETVVISREAGVTEVRFHTNGGPMVWSAASHHDASRVFLDLAADSATKVMIVTGTGDRFCTEIDRESFAHERTWEPIWWKTKRLLRSLLDIDVPVIGAINGPALVHAEIPLLSDVAVAASTAVFADKAHFSSGAIPGDGAHLIWRYLLGPRRAKYFLLTSEEIASDEALRLGVINEVVPPAEVSERAWALARSLAEKPLPFLRYLRETLNMYEREHLLKGLSHGLALEGVAFADVAALESEVH